MKEKKVRDCCICLEGLNGLKAD